MNEITVVLNSKRNIPMVIEALMDDIKGLQEIVVEQIDNQWLVIFYYN